MVNEHYKRWPARKKDFMMQDICTTFEQRKDLFSGRIASNSELRLLEELFSDFTVLVDLQMILSKYKIIGQEFDLGAGEDASEMGINMQWITPNDMVEEAFNFYPGIIAVKHQFIPIGTCMSGSGDPYFLRKESNSYNIYRVLHDYARDGVFADELNEYVITLNDLILIIA
jgi:hypothetical protein